MDISPLGASSPALQSLTRLTGSEAPTRVSTGLSSPNPSPAADTIDLLLPSLPTAQLVDLINTLDAQLASPDPARATHLLQTAESAVRAGEIPQALLALRDYITHKPAASEALLTNHALLPIRSEVHQLLRLTALDARSDAERQLTAASHAVAHAGEHPSKPGAPGIITLAEHLIDTGRLENYFRASQLSQNVLAWYTGSVPDLALSRVRSGSAKSRYPAIAQTAEKRLRRLPGAWHRAPLLVLLAGWLILGLAIGLPALLARKIGFALLDPSTLDVFFSYWAIGFLALVVFQFLATIRRAILRKHRGSGA